VHGHREQQDGRRQGVGGREPQEPDGSPEPVLDLVKEVPLRQRLVQRKKSGQVGIATWDRCYDFLDIFAEKIGEKRRF
jgi:hypothetical protein